MPVYPTTMWDLLEQRAAATPSQVLLDDDTGRTMTALQWRDAALTLAAALYARGITRDTPVSWQLPTVHESAVLLLALARLGAVQNPILHILRRQEVGFIVGQTSARLLITSNVWRNFDYAAMARDVASEHGCETLVIERGIMPAGDPTNLPRPPDGVGDPVRFIYYSSGTTAEPKGARHTDLSVMASANALIVLYDANEVIAIAFPYTHIGGVCQTVNSIYTGARMVFFESFDPVQSPLVMAAHGTTNLGSAVPFFLAFIKAQHEHGREALFPNLRWFVSGGAPKPPDLYYEMKALFGVPILSNWGLTEFPIATISVPDDLDQDLAHAEGRALPNIELKIVDAEGAIVAPAEAGELLVKGPQMFKGYVDASLNDVAFDGDGFFRTGDIGIVGPRGHVQITGRIKDIIIRNAENLSALEIEAALYSHPNVADVAVIGVPDPLTGERAMAVIVLAAGVQTLTLNELADHCQDQQLASQKFPERLEIVDQLPRNSMGKVLKQDLRRRFAGG